MGPIQYSFIPSLSSKPSIGMLKTNMSDLLVGNPIHICQPAAVELVDCAFSHKVNQWREWSTCAAAEPSRVIECEPLWSHELRPEGG